MDKTKQEQSSSGEIKQALKALLIVFMVLLVLCIVCVGCLKTYTFLQDRSLKRKVDTYYKGK